MAKGLIGGMTDYSNQSFEDIIEDLKSENRNLITFIDTIEQNFNKIKKTNFWKTKVLTNFKTQIAFSLKHYKTASEEIREIGSEIQINVKAHHCKRLQKVSDVAREINIEIGKVWNQEYEESGFKDYEDQNFQIVENIYRDTRDMAVNLMDLNNIANRLKDFVGKQNPKAARRKTKCKLRNIFSWTTISLLIITLLFGNNLLERCNRIHNLETVNKKDTKINTTNLHETVLSTFELPFLENVPILDSSIFIKYYYNKFVFGGVNIDSISIGVRSKLGESLEMNTSDKNIQIDITKEPYIELEYKGKLYSIEAYGKTYSFTCRIKENIKQTLQLKKFNDIVN